jgi:hypothetical protein
VRDELFYALAMCEDALAQNERNIADQEARVTRQEVAGASEGLSKSLLKTFHQLRLSYLARRQTILYDLAALTNPEQTPAARFMIRQRTRVVKWHPQGD